MSGPPRFGEAVAAWNAETLRLAGEILVDPVAYALCHRTQHIVTEATAEIARLRAELDLYQGRQVLFCADGQLAAAAEQVTDAIPGTILRATDTGRELMLSRAGIWEPREAY